MNDFERKLLDGHREMLKGARVFQCAACAKVKVRGEAAAVRLWRPDAFVGNAAKRKAATYAICLECADAPESDIHAKVTKYLATQGLFD